jgi:hypothetical protein
MEVFMGAVGGSVIWNLWKLAPTQDSNSTVQTTISPYTDCATMVRVSFQYYYNKITDFYTQPPIHSIVKVFGQT